MALLKWAADENVGHMAWLLAGGEQLVFEALSFAAKAPRTLGARLDDLLDVDMAFVFMQFVLQSWSTPRAREYRRMHGIAEDVGTAVTVQRMVFANCGGRSGSGVAFTHNPASGENRMYLDFRLNSQGEDAVSGRHSASGAPGLRAALPSVAARLQSLRGVLEDEFGDAQEFEFTVQDGVLWLLQTRDAKRTPWAALRIAVEQVRAGKPTTATARRRLAGIDFTLVEQRHVAIDAASTLLASALPASIGVASGSITLDASTAQTYATAG